MRRPPRGWAQPQARMDTMTDLGKSCMMCKHFDIDLGSPNWSEVTPGNCGKVSCFKDMQAPLAGGDIPSGPSTFREWVRFGNTCPAFEPAED